MKFRRSEEVGKFENFRTHSLALRYARSKSLARGLIQTHCPHTMPPRTPPLRTSYHACDAGSKRTQSSLYSHGDRSGTDEAQSSPEAYIPIDL